MMDLTVEIQGDATSLQECLNQFTAKEWLDGDNMYRCDGYELFSPIFFSGTSLLVYTICRGRIYFPFKILDIRFAQHG